MGLRYSSLLKVVGIIFSITGLAMTPAFLTSLFFREFTEAFSFIICIIPALMVGLTIFSSERGRADTALKPRVAIMIASLCWLISSLAGALPYLISGSIPHFIDALFESASGFTTTGATVLENMPDMSKSMMIWRSSTGWLGGLSILILVLGLLSSLGATQLSAQTEPSAGLSERVLPKTRGTARLLVAIYLGLTMLLLLLLLISGMDPFNSLIHALAVISTSGLTNHSAESITYAGSQFNWIIVVFMLLAAMNYSEYFRIMSRHWKPVFRDEEPRWFLIIFLSSSVLMTLCILLNPISEPASGMPYAGVGKAIEMAFFQSASTLSTTGMRNADYTLWPTFCQLIIFFLMVSGGCAASGAGGIKVLRVAIVFKFLRRNIARRIHPSAVVQIKLNGTTLPSEISSAMVGHALLYLVVLFSGTCIVCVSGVDILTSLSSMISCLGNVGPAFGMTGPGENYAMLSPFVKVFLSLVMIAGRLEMATFILLFTPQYWNNN